MGIDIIAYSQKNHVDLLCRNKIEQLRLLWKIIKHGMDMRKAKHWYQSHLAHRAARSCNVSSPFKNIYIIVFMAANMKLASLLPH